MTRSLQILFTILLISSCGRGPVEKPQLITGDVKLSEIRQQENYVFPVRIIKDIDGDIILNGDTVSFSKDSYSLPHSGYYELVRIDGGSRDTTVFNLVDPARGLTEWGLKAWTPAPPAITPLDDEEIVVIYPRRSLNNQSLPVVIFLERNGIRSETNQQIVTTDGAVSLIKNGTGSMQLSPQQLIKGKILIGGEEVLIEPQLLNGNPYIPGRSINDHLELEANSFVHIKRDLKIGPEGHMVIGEGSVVIIDEGINIYNEGDVIFKGSKENPISVTSSKTGTYWGGFISTGTNSVIKASHSFFSWSGFHDKKEFRMGHVFRQALFQATNSKLYLNKCYILDQAGQVFFTINSELTLNHVLIQRALSAGQIVAGDIHINNSVFSDFPNDNQEYMDMDNDALYLDGSDADIKNSVFMYAKDDGIDTGGEKGGVVRIDSCIFEACFHEGVAMSSGTRTPVKKSHYINASIFRNNGQGIELSYSSEMHEVIVKNCLVENNHVGIRLGNTKGWPVEGKMFVSNTISRENDRDIWNMSGRSWEDHHSQIRFEEVYLSVKSSQYPHLLAVD